MIKSIRQQNIIAALEKERIINTQEIAERFGVSIETIRRDLDQLERQGLLKKTYGGAELCAAGPAMPAPVQSRRAEYHDYKVALAKRAAEFVPDKSTVALDAGSTVYELCRFLKAKHNMTIVCGDIHSADELLTGDSSNRIYMMGGFLSPDGTTSGTFVKEFFANIASIDIFMFSTDGVSCEEGFSTEESGINELKKRYIRKAAKKIAIVDHSKFSKRAFYKMCDFSEVDLLITDSLTPKDMLDKIRSHGTQVEVVEIPEE